MKQITKKIFSHQSLLTKKKYYNRDIKKSDALKIISFRQLVDYVSAINFNNPEYSIFYRGQNKDYKNNEKETTILPSFYRDNIRKVHTIRKTKTGRILGTTLKPYDDKLLAAEKLLLEYYEKNYFQVYSKIKKFKELSWSILQHYEVCPTPLLDITHSLRVAATFALKNVKKNGFLFLLGFPHINGSISYYVEEELLNIKLLSTCPPNALRPYYQEGFTVGTFPIPMNKTKQFDFNRRLIGKFRLLKKSFWDKDFTPIPDIALFPDDRDEMAQVCNIIKSKIN